MIRRYNSYSEHTLKIFGGRIHKIPLNSGFTCPNRDGSKGVGGCTYCNNVSFNPFYSQQQKSVASQIEEGISFYSKRYKTVKFLAYFQAYTNTYARLSELKQTYEVVFNYPGIEGIIIGTRPDCINAEMLDYFAELKSKIYLSIEYGIETSHNKTLEFINRCHTYEESESAIKQTASKGINVSAHIILGLPGEDRLMMIETAHRLNELPISGLKIHQLQIIKQTVMAKQYKSNPDLFISFSPAEYVDLVVEFLENLRPDIVIERFISETPKRFIISPDWGGLRTYDLVRMIEKRLKDSDTYQGKKLSSIQD